MIKLARKLSVRLALSVVIGCAATLRGGTPETSTLPPPSDKVWRNIHSCPVNSLYILLALKEQKVDYDVLENRLPVGQQGSSLIDIRNCARAFGLKAMVVKLAPNDLSGIDLPVIAHCEEEKAATGHYVVVTAVTRGDVEYIDGTTAMVDVVPISEFGKRWSGYTLVIEESSWSSWLFPAAVLLGICTIGLAFLIVIQRRKTTDVQRSLGS